MPSTRRRLSVIVCMDVAGYSRLMEADEERTLARLTAIWHDIVEPRLEAHGGRLVKTMGDGLLAALDSAVEAVRWAAEVLEAVATHEGTLPLAERIVFRTGVHLGDVIEQQGDVFGEGVNIAARLQALAEPGSICLSGAVHEHVAGKVGAVCEDLGERSLKNIVRPIRVFRMRPGTTAVPATAGASAAPAPGPAPALALPDIPSIAVLPFADLSGEAAQNAFSDGVVEDIITALSRCSGLFVVARHSSFRYRGQSVDVARTGRELGVRYVLEGSVRVAGRRVRITAQLVEAATHNQVWAERYDRELADVFAVQDEVTASIVGALLPRLDRAEALRVRQKPPGTVEAYDCYVRGRAGVWIGTGNRGAMLAQSRDWLRRALALDPRYAPAYAWLAFNYWSAWIEPSRHEVLDAEFMSPAALERGFALARQAVDLDPGLPEAHAMLGWILTWLRGPAEALASFARALELAPHRVPFGYGAALNFAGRAPDAIAALEKAMRLDPFHSPALLMHLGQALYMLRRYDEAAERFQQCIARVPDFRAAHIWSAAAEALRGRADEARQACDELLRLDPDFSVGAWLSVIPLADPKDAAHLADGVRRLGLLERAMSDMDTTTKRDAPEVIIFPPVILLGTVLLGVLLDWLAPLGVLARIGTVPRVAIGAILLVPGIALTLGGVRGLVRIGTNVLPTQPALVLARTGLFAWTRNPIYLSGGLLLPAVALFLASDWLVLLIAPSFVVLHYGVVLREERYLEAKFGDAYRGYKQSVPRYIWRF